MKCHRTVLLLCRALACLSLTALPAAAQPPSPAPAAAPRITWGWFNAAPYMIAEGPGRQLGIFDQIRSVLKEQMPEYEHKEVQAPFPRIFQEIKNGNPWCFVGGVRSPEREKLAYFSAPVAVFLPFRVIVRKDRLAEFGGTGQVSLAALLGDPALRSSVLRGRLFTPAIDALLKNHAPLQFHSEFNEALQMLLAKRLDYLIELPVIANYSAHQLGREGELTALTIGESDDATVSNVMCARTPWGKQVIERINAVLHAQRDTPRYRRIVEHWSDEDGVRRIRALYRQQLLNAQ